MTKNHKHLLNVVKKKTEELQKSGFKVKDIEFNIYKVLNKFRSEIDSDNVFNSIQKIQELNPDNLLLIVNRRL